MHLIYNINFILSNLWGDTNLITQTSNIIHRVVGCGIQFKDIESKIFIWLLKFVLIDHFGQDTGTSCFTNPARTGKKQGLCQVIVLYGI